MLAFILGERRREHYGLFGCSASVREETVRLKVPKIVCRPEIVLIALYVCVCVCVRCDDQLQSMRVRTSLALKFGFNGRTRHAADYVTCIEFGGNNE